MVAIDINLPAKAEAQVCDQFGLARLGSLYLALPIGMIREVVPFPRELSCIAATRPDLIGAINLRGAIVPVLDLAALLGTGAAAESQPAIIMVLRVQGKVVGVGLDEICGVIALPRDNRTDLSVLPGDPLATSGVLHAGFSHGGRSGIILDVDAIGRLPGIALAEDRMVATAAESLRGEPTLLVSIGEFRLGLPATIIDATIPCRPLQPSPVADDLWIARLDYHGASIPVVDTLRLLGLGHMPGMRETATVLLRFGEGRRVALAIDAVQDILRVSHHRTADMQGFQFGSSGLIRGMLPSQTPVLLLDGQTLSRHEELLRLSHLQEHAAGAPGVKLMEASSRDASGEMPKPYLIFSSGDGHYALALEDVTEILNYESCALVDMHAGIGNYDAILSHRGMAIPIFSVAKTFGLASGTRPSFVALVAHEKQIIGLSIHGLKAVERLVAKPVGRLSQGTGEGGAVVRTYDGQTCSVLGLNRLSALQ